MSGFSTAWRLPSTSWRSDGGLIAAIVGVPAGLEARLEPTGVDTFVMAGGALPGAQTTFTRDVTGTVTGMSFGPFQFQRY